MTVTDLIALVSAIDLDSEQLYGGDGVIVVGYRDYDNWWEDPHGEHVLHAGARPAALSVTSGAPAVGATAP